MLSSKIEKIKNPFKDSDVEIFIKREDLLHPFVSGNKFRKLKYNLEEAEQLNAATIVTFGGAFSNHIAATAAACHEKGLKSVGVIRGEELGEDLDKTLAGNDTLKFAQQKGMSFKFISREAYRKKDEKEFLKQLQEEYVNSYIIPEGGTNPLAVKGCEEILTLEDNKFDVICCAVGTGGTISGIVNASAGHQEVWGFPALKGDFLKKEISKFAKKKNYQLIIDYHFGGYAKVNEELVVFLNEFYKQNQIPLDPIYTGKMAFGIFDLIQQKKITNKKILLIHTGGLQGIKGMNQKLTKKKKSILTYEV